MGDSATAKFPRGLAILFCLAALGGHVAAQKQNNPRDEIEHKYEQMAIALSNKDASAYATFFTPDAKFLDAYNLAHGVVEEERKIKAILRAHFK